MRSVLVTSVISSILAIAAATTPAAAEGEPDRDPYRGVDVQLGVGLLAGAHELGGLHHEAGGVAIIGGYRHHRWLAYGEYDALWFDDDAPVDGLMQRLGLGVRLDVATFGVDLGAAWGGGVLWVDLGAGRERVANRSGARLGRDDVSVGLGTEIVLAFGRDHRRSLSVSYAARAFIAGAPTVAQMAALCTAGCGPTGSPRDVGVMFAAMLTLGR